MIYFNKPENLNGTELRQELLNAGVKIVEHKYAISLESDGRLGLDIPVNDETKAAEVIAAHNGNSAIYEPTIEDKLASVGLSLTDLKSALGLE